MLSSNTYVRHYVNIYRKVYIAVFVFKRKKAFIDKKRLFTKKEKKYFYISVLLLIYVDTYVLVMCICE